MNGFVGRERDIPFLFWRFYAKEGGAGREEKERRLGTGQRGKKGITRKRAAQKRKRGKEDEDAKT